MKRIVLFSLASLILIGCDQVDEQGASSSQSDSFATPTHLPTVAPQVAGSSTPLTSPAPLAASTPNAELSIVMAATNAPILTLVITPIPANIPDYDRDEWRHWIDEDGDCQNARHEVLIKESSVEVSFTNERGCTVATGRWNTPFVGVVVESARSLDVDHMVPLANAHRSGGWAWSPVRKLDYANDMEYAGHLIAVTASANRSKGAKGPEEWRPDNRTYWCQYAVDWVTVKATWELSVTQTEWAALDEMLGTCISRPEVSLSSGSDEPAVGDVPMPKSVDLQSLPFDPNGPDRDCGDFTTWRQAQGFFVAAGGPASDPHRLDGDKDGVACESLPGSP